MLPVNATGKILLPPSHKKCFSCTFSMSKYKRLFTITT